MRLLISVGNAAEAFAACEGGADLIDAKDPGSGALGAVSEDVLGMIHAAVAGRRPVTAALGDASDEDGTARIAQAFARAGTAFVKVGFAGITAPSRIEALLGAARRGAAASGCGTQVVAVGYADSNRIGSLGPPAIIDAAARTKVEGVLIDTADKSGPGLSGLVEPDVLAAWVRRAHDAGLFVALAGKLSADDLPFARDAGADIAGVRGAACDGGRLGHVAANRVRALRERMANPISVLP